MQGERNAAEACYTVGFRGEFSVLMSRVDLPPPWSARETPGPWRVRSRDRKVEIFISNAACKVRGAPPLQVIFMGPPRSNELIFTFYAFILVCPRCTRGWDFVLIVDDSLETALKRNREKNK